MLLWSLLLLIGIAAQATISAEPPSTYSAGGDFVDIADFPYQVSLQYSFYGHVCGGAILSEEWVLTSARCVVQFSVSRLSVVVGTTALDDPSPQRHAVASLEVHPQYSGSPLPDYDIALLKVEPTLIFGERVQPVRLPQQGNEPFLPQTCNFTGWGAKEAGGDLPWDLQRLVQRTILWDLCSAAFSAATGGISLPNTALCATNITLSPPFYNYGPCMGEWGSPLVCSPPLPGGAEPLLLGLLSGDPLTCGRVPVLPNLYTRVSALRQWITDLTGL